MKRHYFITLCCAALMTSCVSEFNKVYKSSDNAYKYEYAKQCFAMGKFQQASVLLSEQVTLQKGRQNAQESLYLLAMSQYCNRDFEAASATFKKYFQSYPKGDYAEQACYHIGQSLFQSVPEPRLDQTPTIGAINAYQNFLDYYPDSPLREDFSVLIMKSKYYLAENSSEEKKIERYRDAEDECYGFLNEFPESKEVKTAEKYIAKCKKYTSIN